MMMMMMMMMMMLTTTTTTTRDAIAAGAQAAHGEHRLASALLHPKNSQNFSLVDESIQPRIISSICLLIHIFVLFS
jgi:hypothetical protein